MKFKTLNLPCITLFVTSIMLGCKSEDPAEYVVTDLTKFRALDSDQRPNVDSTSRDHQLQKGYEEQRLARFHNLLEELDIRSLKDIDDDTTACRIIVDFAWGSFWSGNPLSLSIFESSDRAFVECVEISFAPADSTITKQLISRRQQLNYSVNLEEFFSIKQSIEDSGLWNGFSTSSQNGMCFDCSYEYIELRDQSSYKLIIRKAGTGTYPKLLLAFVRATHYNDTLVAKYKKDF